MYYNLFAGVGGTAIGVAGPYSAMPQQGMYYPTATTMQSISSHQQFQTTSVVSASSSVTQQ